MAIKEKLVWTVLPNGFDAEGRPCVSIVVSPRLSPTSPDEQRLDGYSDMIDWPKTLQGIEFGIRIDGHKHPLNVTSRPDSATWTRIFTPDLWVDAFKFTDLSRHNLRSFPVRHLVRFLKDHYGDLARGNGLERPPLFPLDSSPLGPMIGAASGVRLGREYGHGDKSDVPPGIGHLLTGSSVDKTVGWSYFGSNSRHAPESVRGIDGKPIKNSKGYRRRTLPADLPADLGGEFGGSTAAYALYQANRFYSRPEAQQAYRSHPDPKAVKALIKTPSFDFHKLVASFGDAPSMMRRLGLVVDAVIDDDGKLLAKLQAAGPAGLQGAMSLLLKRSDGDPAGVENHLPRTAWRLLTNRFVVAARPGGDHHDGLLALAGAGDVLRSVELGKHKLEPSAFNLVQVDPDGSAHKMVNFANSMLTHIQKVANSNDPEALNQPGKLTYTTNANRESTPALRSGGLTVIRHDRATTVADDLIASDVKNDAFADPSTSDGMLLYAEDVLRGYRVDVRDGHLKRWRGLCRRIASYRYADDRSNVFDPDEQLNQVRDEGYVRGASTTTQVSPDAVDNNIGTQDHYLHEAVFKWTGWSLVAPRPGKRIVAKNEHGLIQEEGAEAHDDGDQAIGAGKVLTSTAVEPNSLPRLRFGNSYRLRARVVDLAGNGLAWNDKNIGDLEQASDEIVYRRLEPLDPPALALQARLSEGESLERVVIRSDVVEDAGSYKPQSAADYLKGAPYADNNPASSGFAYQALNLRHVVPPKTSQFMAEQHGMFEQAFDAAGSAGGPAAIKAAYETIVGLEAGTLYDGGAPVHLITPAKNGVSPEDKLDPPPGEGFRLEPGQYVIHTEDFLKTPYLPDPLAAAVVLRDVPGVTEPMEIDKDDGVFAEYITDTEELVLYVPFTGTAEAHDVWPHVYGFRIAVAEADESIDAPRFIDDYNARKSAPCWDGKTRTLTVFLRKGEIAPVRYACAVRTDLVHHLALPEWVGANPPWPNPGLLATFGAHWMITPDRTLTLVHATQHPVCPPAFANLHQTRPDLATYADFTRETFVRYHARSTAQLEVLAEWMEWVDDEAADKPVRRKVSARLKEVQIAQPSVGSPDPVKFDYALLGTATEEGLRVHLRHEFGDHKFRFIQYRLLATSRFREYLPPELTAKDDNITRLGPVWVRDRLTLPAGYYDETLDGAISTECGAPLLRVDGDPQAQIVCASGRPQSPKVVYQVPTQTWTSSDNGATHSVVRQGNCLRIYLERPWFSSGEGELLGVIVAAADGSQKTLADLAAHPELEHLVSQWGLDPIFDSDHPRAAVTAAAFPDAVCKLDTWLPEAQRDVTVCGHRVYFDAERKQWFADLRIEAGNSYMPFVRLSLARLQPHAIDGMALSVPVQAPFASLLPRRRVDWREINGVFDFSVYGPAPRRGAGSSQAYLPGMPPFLQALFGTGAGHNRIEVAVQSQAAGYDTDLDWRDVEEGAKASGDAVPHQSNQVLLQFATQAMQENQPSAAMTERSSSALRAKSRLDPGMIAQLISIEDCIWKGRIAVPEELRNGRARLVLREFERHFSDDMETVMPLGIVRNAIVERLVFAREFYVLGYTPTE